jgi:hypothetical protein
MLFALLFFLLAAHALMDYALQTDSIATCKCPDSENPVAKAVPWYYWLTAHAVLHGAAVGAVVRWFGFGWDGVAVLASAETVVHWCIDYGKCRRWYSIAVDQSLHVLCKLAWFSLIFTGVIVP